MPDAAITGLKRPVLFLDFDGVIVHQMHADAWCDDFGPAFDDDKVASIENLQHETNCRIVVISSWRNRAEGGIAAMHRMAMERQLPFTIDDTVLLKHDPRSPHIGNRSDEIDLWLGEQDGDDVGHIAIIDDCMRQSFFSPRHYPVHIQPYWSGMTKADYQTARCLLLHGPNPDLVNRPTPRAVPRP